MSHYKTSAFLFRRDLRLHDNTGLIQALRQSERVIACFIASPKQLKTNVYCSERAVQCMAECLDDLAMQLRQRDARLSLFQGHEPTIIRALVKAQGIDAIFCNRDYTPFARQRDAEIERTCKNAGIGFHSATDALLHEPEELRKEDGAPYRVFTPFFRRAIALDVRMPTQARGVFFADRVPGAKAHVSSVFSWQPSKEAAVHGGRTHALAILRRMDAFRQYACDRDIPSKDATTHLSAHLTFGTISVREAYGAIVGTLGEDHPLIRQLYWREFFTHVAWHFPHVFGHAFRTEFQKLQWSRSQRNFQAWCKGKTGVPIVDAGMRQLNATGYMHNRVRMIASSFLVKDLHIDWRKGEQYFAQRLLDYDPSVNNGNWQWSASTGCDAQPWFRIFNPWLQQKRYDPACAYIKKWIPELAEWSVQAIQGWGVGMQEQKRGTYPRPIVDHARESAFAKDIYARITRM